MKRLAPSPPTNDGELLVASPTTTHSSQAGQYYVLLADITAHHTGYHKLVEQPLEHSSPSPAAVAAISEAVSSSSPLPLHHHLEGSLSGNTQGDTMGKDEMRATTRSRYRELLVLFVAEFLGTKLLIFFGCIGCLSAMSTKTSPLQPGLSFGFTVASIIQIFGHISGAHLNPAISLAAVILGKLTIVEFLVYTLGQTLGAVAGYGLLKWVTPAAILVEESVGDHGFCMTLPSSEISTFQAFNVEFLACAFLILVYCSAMDIRNASKHDSMPIKFGIVIAALAFCAGPYTGASMNPARSFGPAFWNGNFNSHWFVYVALGSNMYFVGALYSLIYWVANLLSALIVSAFYRFFFWVNDNKAQEPQVQLATMRNQGDDDNYVDQSLV